MVNVVQIKWQVKLIFSKLNLIGILAESKNNLLAWQRFWRSYKQYDDLLPVGRKLSDEKLYPCIGDDTVLTPIEPTYYFQDSWAFEQIINRMPASHVDIGSHHTFVAHLSKVLPVTMVDIRPLALEMPSIRFQEGSILSLPYADQSLDSVSSLCVVEHIGLGRYGHGDPLDPDGTEKALEELKRVIAPNGYLYISLPVDDRNTTYFNAHRAFSEQYILDLFGNFDVVEKRYIYGKRFVKVIGNGFGVACYVLRKK